MSAKVHVSLTFNELLRLVGPSGHGARTRAIVAANREIVRTTAPQATDSEMLQALVAGLKSVDLLPDHARIEVPDTNGMSDADFEMMMRL